MKILDNIPPNRFTSLHARITEEECGFRISVRMHNNQDADDNAWGVETASSIEVASDMIARLADQFSIPQSCISIRIVMNSIRESTLH